MVYSISECVWCLVWFSDTFGIVPNIASRSPRKFSIPRQWKEHKQQWTLGSLHMLYVLIVLLSVVLISDTSTATSCVCVIHHGLEDHALDS